MQRTFSDLFESQWQSRRFLSVGLDSDYEKLPEAAKAGTVRESLERFNRAIVDRTKDVAGSYKINSAFYEAHGDEGWAAMRVTIAYINANAPTIPVILDAKRADIGNTNFGYVRAAFDNLRADAITVQPYAGKAALAPFLAQREKGIIVWCRSSNEGAGEFQDLDVGGEPLYLRVARSVADSWNENGNCALVAGATYPAELARVRAAAPTLPILVPGIGAQGGDVRSVVGAAKRRDGGGMMIAASRGIIFASRGDDYAEAAGAAARSLHEAIVQAL